MSKHQLQELLDKPVRLRGINHLGDTPALGPGQPNPNVSAAKDVKRVAVGSHSEAAPINKVSTQGDKERPSLPSKCSNLAHEPSQGEELDAAMMRVGDATAHRDPAQRAKKRQKGSDVGIRAQAVQDTTVILQHPVGANPVTAAASTAEHQDQRSKPAERQKSQKKAQLQQEQKQQQEEQQPAHKVKEPQPEIATKAGDQLRRDCMAATGAAVTTGVSQPGTSGDEPQLRVAKKPRLRKAQEEEKPSLGRYAADEPRSGEAPDADKLRHKKKRFQEEVQRPPSETQQPGKQQVTRKRMDDKVKMSRMDDVRAHTEEAEEEGGRREGGRGPGKDGPKSRGSGGERDGEGPYKPSAVTTAVEIQEGVHHHSKEQQLQGQEGGQWQGDQSRTRSAKHELQGNDTQASQQRQYRTLEKQKRGKQQERALVQDQPLDEEGKKKEKKKQIVKQQQRQGSAVVKAEKTETSAEKSHMKSNLLGGAADAAHLPVPALVTSSLAMALGGRAAIAAAAATIGAGVPNISAVAKPAAGAASSCQKQTHAAALAALQQRNSAVTAAAAAAAAVQPLPSAGDDRNGGGKGTTAAALSAAAVRQVGRGQKAAGKKIAGGFLDKMRAKLAGGRFRYLNEELYTRSGKDAFTMMQSQPELFLQYHEGFQRQTRGWPKQPVDVAIGWLISKRSEIKVVADFGCGDAKIAASVPQTVHSFDLVASAPGVIACNMSDVPLPDASVDAAIFSLALMGIDYGSFLEEAVRVLRPKGWLWIAEVRSRFARGAADMHTAGSDDDDGSHGEGKAAGDEDFQPFLSCLKSLGLRILSEDAGNKMFVVWVLRKGEVGKQQRNGKRGGSSGIIPWPELKACMYKKR
ncbi:hypothetical protein VaNZ11_009028 [Volvox africanus]|uniref:Ribosomal RNA-processing protein 8 n=1 Tax=Volvox africanus TaxID=51714 RepID=A0ABQ5S6E9_9CHLO|nr:hypothetical protein VaNZ11_009028 [Volvox africanus]